MVAMVEDRVVARVAVMAAVAKGAVIRAGATGVEARVGGRVEHGVEKREAA